MTNRRRVEAIVDHAMVARQLAIDADESFLAQLIELVLCEAGTRLGRLESEGAAAKVEGADTPLRIASARLLGSGRELAVITSPAPIVADVVGRPPAAARARAGFARTRAGAPYRAGRR